LHANHTGDHVARHVGTLQPIYRRLTDGSAVAGPNGLDSIRLKPGAGYANELMYVERSRRRSPMRCVAWSRTLALGRTSPPGPAASATSRLVKDLSVTYRFSIDLLPHWREIERDVRTRLEAALVSIVTGV
jgi:hypothetical protein